MFGLPPRACRGALAARARHGATAHCRPTPATCCAQVLGALAGAALQVLITPGLAWGQAFGPSCHAPAAGLGGTGLYVWETLAAFVFV